MGNTVDDQQLGCLWSGDFMLSVSLSGYINYLDPSSPSKPSRILKGHNKPITKVFSQYSINVMIIALYVFNSIPKIKRILI